MILMVWRVVSYSVSALPRQSIGSLAIIIGLLTYVASGWLCHDCTVFCLSVAASKNFEIDCLISPEHAGT